MSKSSPAKGEAVTVGAITASEEPSEKNDQNNMPTDIIRAGKGKCNMRATKIKIKNLFGISVLEIGGQSVELTGKNGAGKSSVLDAIKYALTNASDREYIIKEGEKEGEIYIETDTGLSIDRKKRTIGSDYKSLKQGNRAIGGPEAVLKSIFTPLQLNPMEFVSMNKKQQNAMILDMIEYEWDLDTIKKWFGELPQNVNYDQNILSVLNDIQAENGYYYQHRQDVNREIRAKKAIASDIKEALPFDYDGSEWERKEVGPLYREIERIRHENAEIEEAKRTVEGHDGKIRKFQADKEIALAALDREMMEESERIGKEIAALEERLSSLHAAKGTLAGRKADKAEAIEAKYNASVAKLNAEIEKSIDLSKKDTLPVDELEEKARITEQMKGFVGEWKRMLDIEATTEKLESESDALTKKIEKARNLPGEILATAKIPIEGLSVKDGIPLINGLPISNLSEGEKLQLCIDVAVQNPTGLQIILIDGTEKLTQENREKLYQKCREKGLQMIATRTTENDDLTVIEL